MPNGDVSEWPHATFLTAARTSSQELPLSGFIDPLACVDGMCQFGSEVAIFRMAGTDVTPGFLERGETEVPGTSSPIVRRRELGARLRALRTEKGWTIEQVAERLLMSSSKVSRLETGQRGANARDIRDLSDLYGLDDAQRQRLIDLAKAGKQHPGGSRSPCPIPHT